MLTILPQGGAAGQGGEAWAGAWQGAGWCPVVVVVVIEVVVVLVELQELGREQVGALPDQQ